MQDLTNNIQVLRALVASTITATTVGTLYADLQQFEQIAVAVTIETVGTADATNLLTFSVEESDSSSFASGNTAVPAIRIIGTATVINATAQATTTAKFGVVKGLKRYLRVVVTETGTASANVAALWLLGSPRRGPVA